MSLRDFVADAIAQDPGISDEALADQILEAGDPSIIFPAIVNSVRLTRATLSNLIIRRAGVERVVGGVSAISDPNPSMSPPTAAHDPLALRLDVLNERKIVPGRGYVLIGAMTVEDHQARITDLFRSRDGIDRAVAFHRQAIEEIEAAGVTCLNDIAQVPA